MKKNKFKVLISIIVTILLIGGLVAVGIVLDNARHQSDKEGYTVVTPTFTVGGLNVENGNYLVTESSIYTKDMFECAGLIVTPEFDSKVTYTIFFYDEEGKFISATEDLKVEFNEELPEGATQCRIMVTPVWAESVAEENRVITALEVYGYSSDITIEVLLPVEENEVEIIEFTLDYNSMVTTTEKCEKGMTWADWFDSEYGPTGDSLNMFSIEEESGIFYFCGSSVAINMNDVIESKTYKL